MFADLLAKQPGLAHYKFLTPERNLVTLLMYVASYSADNTLMAQLVLSHKPDLDARDNTGKTALMIAAKFGNGSICNLLISRQRSLIHAVDHNGDTALMDTIFSNTSSLDQKIMIFELLLKHTPDEHLFQTNQRGESLYVLTKALLNNYKNDRENFKLVEKYLYIPLKIRLANITLEDSVISYDLKGRLSLEETYEFKEWLAEFIT